MRTASSSTILAGGGGWRSLWYTPLDRDPSFGQRPLLWTEIPPLDIDPLWTKTPPLWTESQTGEKYYLPATSFAGGNKRSRKISTNKNQEDIPSSTSGSVGLGTGSLFLRRRFASIFRFLCSFCLSSAGTMEFGIWIIFVEKARNWAI